MKTNSTNSLFNNTNMKMAQSASALGAGILGFGLGAKWGMPIKEYALFIIAIGSIFHVYGMYIMQMKNHETRIAGVAKTLWISAWICLIALVAIVFYTLVL